MENVNGVVSEETTKQNAEMQQVNEISSEHLAELSERVKQLEASKERILAESKEYKSKYQNLRDEVNDKERTQLEEAGNYQELLEKERNARRELEAKAQSLKKQTLKSNLVSEVARFAPDAFDVADVMNNLPQEKLVMNEDSLTVAGVKEAVALVKQTKPWLFNNNKSTGMASSRPVKDIPKEETLQEKIEKDPRGMLRDALTRGNYF